MAASRKVSYRAAGFGGELGLGRQPALLVVDLMVAYFDKSSPMYAAVEHVAASVIRLVDAAYRNEVPVFFTQQFYSESTANAVYARKVPVLQLLRPGSPLAALTPALPAERGTIIVKSYPSAFHRTASPTDWRCSASIPSSSLGSRRVAAFARQQWMLCSTG